jgi:hypothetical protein
MASATETSLGRLVWRTSTHSGTGDCVEVAIEGAGNRGLIFIRDSKDTAGPRLSFSRHHWSTFVDFVRCGSELPSETA